MKNLVKQLKHGGRFLLSQAEKFAIWAQRPEETRVPLALEQLNSSQKRH